MELPKDRMFVTRNTIRGKNKKGGDRTQLYLTLEEATELASTIAETLKTAGERGIKLDFHTSQRESQDGRQFESTIFFVKPVLESVARGPAHSSAPKKFVPKTAAINKTVG